MCFPAELLALRLCLRAYFIFLSILNQSNIVLIAYLSSAIYILFLYQPCPQIFYNHFIAHRMNIIQQLMSMMLYVIVPKQRIPMQG